MKTATGKAITVLSTIKTDNIIHTNTLKRAAENLVGKCVLLKTMKKVTSTYWKKNSSKTENNSKNLRKADQCGLEKLQHGFVKENLERMCRLKEREKYIMHEDVQQQLITMKAEIIRYDNHIRQFWWLCLFKSNQKVLFKELEQGCSYRGATGARAAFQILAKRCVFIAALK